LKPQSAIGGLIVFGAHLIETRSLSFMTDAG
jgi:hypothetical protein